MFFVFFLLLGLKSALREYESHQVSKLTTSIKNKQTCANAVNLMECSYQQFLLVANRFTDPLIGQEFLSEVVKLEIEKSPENSRRLKDLYFIYAADLYIRTLKSPRNVIIGYVPLIRNHNIDVRIAKSFQRGMIEYSNRREVDRTIASETILQEVSNFNTSLRELTNLTN
jgi:hypothetical protein